MPKYREASTVIVVDGDKILILRRGPKSSNSGFWNFPGGSVEEGESFDEAGVRELKEEADIDVSIRGLKYIGNIILGNLRIHFHITDSFEGEVNINEESDDYAWATLEEMKNYTFVGGGDIHPELIRRIKNFMQE